MDDQDDTSYFSDENATFGDRVQAGRESLGLSQEEFAHKLGVKLKTVRGWEDDLAEPRANKLQMMAGLMNVTIMWLLTGTGNGLREPDDGTALAEDVRDILMDMRKAQAEMSVLTNRIGALEKRLSRALSNG